MANSILLFDICEPSNCVSLVFNDTTGAYDADNNSTGYGTPNSVIAGATSILTITKADLTSYTISLPSTFPTVDKTLEYTIQASVIGYPSSQIDDQIITAVYTVTLADTTVLTQTKTFALYGKVKCCVESMFIDLDIDCEDCMKSLGSRNTNAYLMLKGLEYSAGCGNTTVFNKTLTQLKKICGNTDCQSCK